MSLNFYFNVNVENKYEYNIFQCLGLELIASYTIECSVLQFIFNLLNKFNISYVCDSNIQ